MLAVMPTPVCLVNHPDTGNGRERGFFDKKVRAGYFCSDRSARNPQFAPFMLHPSVRGGRMIAPGPAPERKVRTPQGTVVRNANAG